MAGRKVNTTLNKEEREENNTQLQHKMKANCSSTYKNNK